MRVLITGFGRFPGAAVNPSGPLAFALTRRRRPALAGCHIADHVFATSYAAVDRDLPALLARHRPDVLLMFGLAGRSRTLRIETRARNRVSLLHTDAAGVVPARPRITSGASARPARAPLMRLHAAARGRVPTSLSRDAGAYVCNYLYWQALAAPTPVTVFVHIPPSCQHRPKRRDGKPVRLPGALLATVETMLVALIAAARRPATFPSETAPILRS